MSMAEEVPHTREQSLNAMGAALLGFVGIAAAPLDALATSSAEVNKKLTR